jgi:hypothetical protein
MMLWSSKNLTLSYERIINKKQSITFSLGYLEFPNLIKDTIASLVTITNRHKQGINVALEYRFYLMQRNRRPIPDGIYVAPYLSFYGYQFSNGLNIVDSPSEDFAKLEGSFYSFNLGFELGYQFVFWKRLTLDLILIGPSMSYYGGRIDITGELDGEKVKEINEDLYNQIIKKYPMVEDFVVNKSFVQNGKLDLFSIGFRYLMQIGFHF